MVDLLDYRRLKVLILANAALMAGTYLSSGSKARALKRLFSVELMRRCVRPATREATNVPTLKRIGTVARLPAIPRAACTGCCWTWSSRRTSGARRSRADSITSSRRRFRVSISVTGGSESVTQRLLVALEDGDRVLQQRTAVFRRVEQIGDAAGARDE